METVSRWVSLWEIHKTQHIQLGICDLQILRQDYFRYLWAKRLMRCTCLIVITRMCLILLTRHTGTPMRIFICIARCRLKPSRCCCRVQLFDTEASSQLFKAGLELGLRYYYDSNPEHLRIDAYAEYNKATQNFDNYLELFMIQFQEVQVICLSYTTKQNSLVC